MTALRFIDHFLGPDTHTNRPAANAVPKGAKYVCTTHGLIYSSDQVAWTTWATLGSAYDPEAVRDTIGAALVGGAGIAVAVDDPGDTITITNTGATTRAINAQTGTSYTLVLGDAGKFVTMTNAGASTLTVPLDSDVAFPVGTVIEGSQLGAGQVTLTPTVGVTISGTPGLKVAAQYGTFGLIKTATDTWLAYGRLSA
jgi:hypothetical protein